MYSGKNVEKNWFMIKLCKVLEQKKTNICFQFNYVYETEKLSHLT